MSDMCFGVSEHIASKFPPADVSEIDKFLARKHVNEFKLQDILDLPIATENGQPILDEFTKFRVVKPAIRYICPTHKDEALKLRTSLIVTRKGHCHRCRKSHLLSGLEVETIFRRKREPMQWSDSESSTLTVHGETHEQPLFKDKKWIIERGCQALLTLAAIGSCVFAALGLLLQYYQESPTKTPISTTLTIRSISSATATLRSTQDVEQTLDFKATSTGVVNPLDLQSSVR